MRLPPTGEPAPAAGPPSSGGARSQGERYWEIDLLRGVAIVMMVIYHLLWDLSFFGAVDVDVFSGFWRLFQRATASLFLLVVGVSLHISTLNRRRTGATGFALFRATARRGLIVFLSGMIVTVLTWLVLPDQFVVFGILHLIGTSMVLAYPFRRLGVWNVIPGLLVLLAGNLVQGIRVDVPWLVWLGLMPRAFASVDYFPLLPWFGVVLLGLALGAAAYGATGRRFPAPPGGASPPARLLCFLGRYSLLIYLIHQPILIALLVLAGIVNPAAFM